MAGTSPGMTVEMGVAILAVRCKIWTHSER